MKRVLLIGIILALAAVGPNIFPAAQAGYSNLATLAKYALLPSIIALVATALAIRTRQPNLYRAIVLGGIAGAVATVPLEIVRLTGFHFGYMPGNLPRLMGVLLLNRFMLGPSIASDVAAGAITSGTELVSESSTRCYSELDGAGSAFSTELRSASGSWSVPL
jgi:hypothetical protein